MEHQTRLTSSQEERLAERYGTSPDTRRIFLDLETAERDTESERLTLNSVKSLLDLCREENRQLKGQVSKKKEK